MRIPDILAGRLFECMDNLISSVDANKGYGLHQDVANAIRRYITLKKEIEALTTDEEKAK